MRVLRIGVDSRWTPEATPGRMSYVFNDVQYVLFINVFLFCRSQSREEAEAWWKF